MTHKKYKIAVVLANPSVITGAEFSIPIDENAKDGFTLKFVEKVDRPETGHHDRFVLIFEKEIS